jgi:transposase InsO family protein
MSRGFVYLAAVLDWASRRVLAWRVSISMSSDFCMEAVEEALAKYGKPEIFNTDQGIQMREGKASSPHNVELSCIRETPATTIVDHTRFKNATASARQCSTPRV